MKVAQCHLDAFNKRPEQPGGRYHTFSQRKIYYVCSNCQLVCHPDKAERKRRIKLVKDAGVIVQNEDGTLEAVAPDEARKRLDAMDPETRAMYEGPVEVDPRDQEELVNVERMHRQL